MRFPPYFPFISKCVPCELPRSKDHFHSEGEGGIPGRRAAREPVLPVVSWTRVKAPLQSLQSYLSATFGIWNPQSRRHFLLPLAFEEQDTPGRLARTASWNMGAVRILTLLFTLSVLVYTGFSESSTFQEMQGNMKYIKCDLMYFIIWFLFSCPNSLNVWCKNIHFLIAFN